jgi:hypothetical protein
VGNVFHGFFKLNAICHARKNSMSATGCMTKKL